MHTVFYSQTRFFHYKNETVAGSSLALTFLGPEN